MARTVVQDYDETNELIIADAADTEEAAKNRALMEQLEASIAAAATTSAASGLTGRGSREKKRGRGRPPSRAGAQHAVQTKGPQMGGRPRRTVSFVDEFDEDILMEEYQEQTDQSSRPGSRISRKQMLKALKRLVENRGQWEVNRARANDLRAGSNALPDEALQSLQECAAPQPILDVLGKACDLSSSLKYFQGPGRNPAFEEATTQVETITRLITMLAAASGLVDAQEGLSKQEIESLGLDGIAKLPDPGNPLDPEPSIQSLPAVTQPFQAPAGLQTTDQLGFVKQPFQAAPAPPFGYLPGRVVQPQAVQLFNQNSMNLAPASQR